ncbi:DUF3905 domain-containing protein [Bacillus solimangrovi]|uniref:DUF3905 domain-containing protein n=1 Tax=Bacillus solimangrovi TaxID=1305675 RepID=A0A1E5LD39_9BACI|nr:DUF3905 domain-containing protein [Bacillus solimangrovi]OEH92008.1 hypothetical protein BFG57_17235 [Bacillus solimangrovi]
MTENDHKFEFIDKTMPHQISSPDFKKSNIKPQEPFVNKHGVVIGDSLYNSKNSPLNQWSIDTDPEIMAGDEWIHPTNDIGWNTEENRKLLEKESTDSHERFMHNSEDTSYRAD